jgi:glycyl-tRNA synthetase
LNDNFHEIETANIMHKNVFAASGHLENFVDPIAHCSACDFSERADHLLEGVTKKRYEGLTEAELTDAINENNLKCPKCQADFKPVTVMNMMFSMSMGTGGQQTAYLRPETAQSPYVNFKLQFELLRKKLPLGLALIGRAYRNEISPRNLTLRLREFTQAELQIFFNPNKINEHEGFEAVKDYPLRCVLEEDREANMVVERTPAMLVESGLPKFYVYHMVKVQQFYLEVLKISKDAFRLYQLDDKEKAFYNKYHFDIEVELADYGFTEVGGIHYRTDHDLSGHQEVSKEKMEILDESTGERFIPHVLELSFGVDRNVYTLLDKAYEEDKERGNIVFHLPNKLTPYYCAVFPLVKNKEELTIMARKVYSELLENFSVLYDQSGSVGRRYARADEQGVRYCITVDFDSLEDEAVTIRDRETTKQERIKIIDLVKKLQQLR